MKWFKVFLVFAGLLLGAASAGADPIEEWTFDYDGETVVENSWNRQFKLTANITSDRPVQWIQGMLEGDTFQDTAFKRTGGKAGWYEAFSSDTQFLATGNVITGTQNLTFKVFGESSGGEPPISFKLHLQAYGLEDGVVTQQANVTFQAEWVHNCWTLVWGGKTTGEWTQNGLIPEPFSMAFLGSAFVGVVGFRLRKRRKEGST